MPHPGPSHHYGLPHAGSSVASPKAASPPHFPPSGVPTSNLAAGLAPRCHLLPALHSPPAPLPAHPLCPAPASPSPRPSSRLVSSTQTLPDCPLPRSLLPLFPTWTQWGVSDAQRWLCLSPSFLVTSRIESQPLSLAFTAPCGPTPAEDFGVALQGPRLHPALARCIHLFARLTSIE